MSGPSHSPPHSQHPLSPESPSPALPSSDLDAQKSKLSTFGHTSNSPSTSPPTDYSMKNTSILTPPASVPMSAQSSITSQPIASVAHNPDAPPGNIPAGAAQPNLDGDVGMDDTNQRLGAKRKLESIEEEEERGRNKCARTEEDEQQQPAEEAKQSPSYLPVGPPPIHLIRPETYVPSRPYGGDNLLSVYNLDEVALSVARKDPVTGEKINKLRKSYDNKIKEIPGKNKSVSTPGEFMNMVRCPELEWNAQHVAGNDVEKGLTDEMMSKLDKALNFGSGKLPHEEHEKWRDLLSPEHHSNPAKGSLMQKAGSKTSKMSGTQNATNQASPTSPTRPTRRGTKRSYHDQSFEGYGEGFMDDIPDAGAYDEGDDGQSGPAAKKRRRRDTSGVASPPLAGGMHQYSSSAVSVGGSGIHGR